MVLQYKLKTARAWRDYPGKTKIECDVSKCDFRLLSKDRKKILVDKGDYESVMTRFRQIEFCKRRGK